MELPAFQSMLPSSMTIVPRDSAYYIEVETQREEDGRAQFHVARELDRLFFLTCVRVKAEMCRRTVSTELNLAWNILGPIPPGTEPQEWSYELGLQLRLWSLACETTDPLAKVVLLYQIIELAHPKFLRYSDEKQPPDPLTECKLLRHLIVHAGDVDDPALRAYCKYLNIPPLMLDRTDNAYVDLISAKCKFVEEQARRVLQSAL